MFIYITAITWIVLHFLLYLDSCAFHTVERYNKKCKNLTSNKMFPFESLANALVRDTTARFHCWRQGKMMARHVKTPRTAVDGKSQTVELGEDVTRKIVLSCGCHVARCAISEHSKAVIVGKRFNAGEKLLRGRRCGSVVTRTIDGHSIYGLVKQFLRVTCVCPRIRFYDFAVVTWLPRPTYPDGDPLTVQIDLDMDVNNMIDIDVVSLYDIEPSRITVGHDQQNSCIYMMRLEGLDRM